MKASDLAQELRVTEDVVCAIASSLATYVEYDYDKDNMPDFLVRDVRSEVEAARPYRRGEIADAVMEMAITLANDDVEISDDEVIAEVQSMTGWIVEDNERESIIADFRKQYIEEMR